MDIETHQLQDILKGHSTHFIHEGQFTHHEEYYSACENFCIITLVAL